MSGECNFFKFCLRGENSLACKWMNQKRKTEGGLKSDGANIYAIADYIHSVFKFEKLYGKEYTSTILFNKICAINGADKDYIVKFDEAILIPFGFSPRSAGTAYSSFDEISELFAEEVLCNKKLRDILSKDEIKETLINTYHINYDLRSNENIKNKKYDEIIKGEFLDSRNNTELFFFVPYVIEIPAKEVVASSTEAPVDVALTETSVTPEVKETAVEGYFYVKDTGEYAGKNGTSEDCYILNEETEIAKDLNNAKYNNKQVKKIEITHEQFNQICGVIYDEDSGSFEIMAALTQTSYNAVNLSKQGLKLAEKSKYVANLLFNTGYSTVSTKKKLEDTDKTDKQKLMRKALIHVLLGKNDYSEGGVRWDGIDFLTRGKNHPKAKTDGGISITKDLWTKFVDNWGATTYNDKEYIKEDTINNIPFIESNLTGEAKQKAIDNVKKGCINLYQVTDSLFETEGTGIYNKGNILNKATTVIGETIFWGTNKSEPKNKGYIWSNLLNSNWFKIKI